MVRYLALILLASFSVPISVPVPIPIIDFTCLPSGDEIEIYPLNSAFQSWLDREGFYPWIWTEGKRVRIDGLYSPGYRNGEAFLVYARESGWIEDSVCGALVERNGPQN